MQERIFALLEETDLEFFWASLGHAYMITQGSTDDAVLADAHGAYIGGGPL